ncbi:MAG: hypothetical protein L3J29_01945 [Cyclobacteriaceae bacterium]|nr:hypothetical protein [Cyclobacteriaceae bacterium]
MWRYYFSLGLVCIIGTANAQVQKHFKIEHNNRYKSVTLNYGASSGVCYVSPGESDEPIAVYSDRDIDEFNHTFNKSTINSNLEINLSLEAKNKQTFSQSISSKMFSNSSPEDNTWKVYLAENIPYNLNMVFGVGAAYIDLSGINVNRFNVRAGSADVNIDYLTSMPNPVVMDSFNVKVDLGNVVVRKLYMSRAKYIHAEVGFGSMQLDFTETPTVASHIKASVGAGTLEILIPKNDCSVIIRIKDTMLCDVHLTKSFKEIGDNVFVNEEYNENAANQLSFDVDVSLGNIIFKEKR